jgi:hypothetical protein
MSKMETNLAPEELRLLRGILESHKDQLEQLQDGEPWQPEELRLTNQLIERFSDQTI